LSITADPPIIGITHFFSEAIATEEQRIQREKELICEFNPIGNKTGGAGLNGSQDIRLVFM
jgi:hypothetical protein